MATQDQRLNTMKKVERLFKNAGCQPVKRIEIDLLSLGFTEKGADPVAVAFENRKQELYLEVELDENRCIHSYILVPLEEKDKRQRKFRW
jgi:hypothetical protein